jgi:hypothetical protein
MRAKHYRKFVVAVAAVLLVLPVVAFAAGSDVQINSDPPGTVQNEIRITQSATNPANLVVAYNDTVGAASSPLGVSFSTDTGATWTDRQLGIPIHPLLLTPLSRIFDPFIDSDSQGTIYAGYIAADNTVAGPSGIYIESSTDGGSTWSGPTTIDFNIAALGPFDPTYRFNDRSDMTVDGNDDVYVVWIKDVGVGQPTSDIYFAKSPPPGPPGPGNPTGLDFTGVGVGSVAPQTVSDVTGLDRANAPDVAVAADGTVYVAWIDVDVTNPLPQPGTLKIDSSFTGGVAFGPDKVVAGIAALSKHVSTTAGAGTFDDARAGSYPVIAVDPANSQTVYLAYAADPPGADEADIFFIKSTDGGVTWAAPLTVNDDGTSNDQIHPAIAVKADGTIDLAWYDKRNAANDDQWDVYFANSIDGGASFGPNRRITDQSFTTPSDTSGSPWIGEYLGIDVDATTAYIAFTSGISDSRGDVFFDAEPNSVVQQVVIDIKPGSDPNSINCSNSRGVIPVAILTTATFDATTVDHTTVTFESAAETHVNKKTGVARRHQEDADGDGDLDLVLHFRLGDSDLTCASTVGTLTGTTFGGTPITGTDAVRMVGGP